MWPACYIAATDSVKTVKKLSLGSFQLCTSTGADVTSTNKLLGVVGVLDCGSRLDFLLDSGATCNFIS